MIPSSRLFRASLAVLILLVPALAQDDAIKAVVKSVKDSYAPDRRTVVYDVAWSTQGPAVVLKGELDNPEVKAALIDGVKKATASAVVDSIRMLPDTALGEKLYGIVILSVGNVRSRPDNDEELSTQVLMGTVVKLLKERSGYYYIQMPDRYLGWISKGSVQAVTKSVADGWDAETKVIVTQYYGTVREQSDIASFAVCDVVAGGIFKAGSESGGWRAVELADGRKGYIEAALVQEHESWKKSRRLTGENIATIAKMFIGVPYLWGGTSIKGMDCSGFTKIVYRLNGVELNRDASQQALMGKEVVVGSLFENARMGDLLFFGQKATGDKPERITHVGIYLENRMFIHAGSKNARIAYNSMDPASNIFDDYLLEAFVRARRIIVEPAVPEVRK